MISYEEHCWNEQVDEFLRDLEQFDDYNPNWWDRLRGLVIQHKLGSEEFSQAYQYLKRRDAPSLYDSSLDYNFSHANERTAET